MIRESIARQATLVQLELSRWWPWRISNPNIGKLKRAAVLEKTAERINACGLLSTGNSYCKHHAGDFSGEVRNGEKSDFV